MSPSRRPGGARLAGIVLIIALALIPVAGVSASVPTAQSPTVSPGPGPGDTDPALYEAVQPEQREAIIASTAGRLSRYRIEATMVPDEGEQRATITGTEAIRFYNGTGGELTEVYFRLYANDAEYAEGRVAVENLTVDGTAVSPELSVEDTVVRVPLPVPVAAEATAEIALTFATTVPTQPSRSYGMFAVEPEAGTWALAHWYPVLAGFDPVSGWELDPPSELGDPIFSNTALYDVTLIAPAELVLVTSGSQLSKEASDAGTRHRFVTGPVRDFTVVADDNFESVSDEVGGTTVISHYNPEHAEDGAEVLRFGVQALTIFNDLFGAYPYEELDLVEVALRNGAAGVEFPQLVFLGDDYYGRDLSDFVPGFLDFVVGHEVAHQWWYAMVGNNQYDDAFIDEGLTNYVTTVYFARQYGPESGQEQTNLNLKLPYLSMLFTAGDEIVDQPTDDFPSQASYGSIVYGKAALGFGAIHEAIGDDAFFAALRDYAELMRFQVATPADLLAAFERASGQDLHELWRHWFEAEEGRQDYSESDYRDLLNSIGR